LPMNTMARAMLPRSYIDPSTRTDHRRSETHMADSPRSTIRSFQSVVTLAILILLFAASESGAVVSPRAPLDEFLGHATRILADATDPRQALDEIRPLARALFDGRGAARHALAAEWTRRSASERDEFTRAFSDTLELAYLRMVHALLPRDRRPTIRVLGEEPLGDGGAIVRTLVEGRDGNDVRVDYTMGRAGEAWLVRDVAIEGSSLVESYRAQFARMLRRERFADLLARLRAIGGTPPAEAVTATPQPDEPVSAAPAPPRRPADVVVYFDTSGTELSTTARRELDSMAAWLAENEAARVEIEGHADPRGDEQRNRALAEARARVVRRYLASTGVGEDRVGVVTYGGERPVCAEQTEQCWARARRAVVRVTR